MGEQHFAKFVTYPPAVQKSVSSGKRVIEKVDSMKMAKLVGFVGMLPQTKSICYGVGRRLHRIVTG